MPRGVKSGANASGPNRSARRHWSDRSPQGVQPPVRISRILPCVAGWTFFGLLALSVGAVLLPAQRLLRLPNAELRAQRWINAGYRIWERVVIGTRMIGVRWEGLEALESHQPRIYVANHPSLIDAPLILARMRYGDVIVSEERARNWVLRGAVREAGYISNDRGRAAVDAGVARLRAGRSLLLFPEGTRSPRGSLGRFQRGAAHIALKSGCEIVPIVVLVEPPILGPGQKWYDVARARGVYTLTVEDAISPKQFADDGRSSGVNARLLTDGLRELFSERLRGGRSGAGK